MDNSYYGISEYEKGLAIYELIKRADIAFYHIKRNAKGTYQVWYQDLPQHI
jgi:GGDEF domain-containing protein